jgi:hypothetical protein
MLDYQRSTDMLRRFISYGLTPSAACLLEADILKWESHSGPEWTVKRLKSLKQDFVRIQAGDNPLTYVKLNRRGRWFGVWGYLIEYAAKSLDEFEIVLNCLMVYSSFIPSQPTEKHIASMRASVESNPVSIPDEICNDVARHAAQVLGCNNQLGPSQSLLTFRGKAETKAPIFGEGSVRQFEHLEKELRWMKNPYNKLFLNRHYTVYSKVLEGIDNLSLCEPLQGLSGASYHLSDYGPFETVHSRLRPPFMAPKVGSIVPLTKDGGWKVRWIASPYRIHQMALQPLGSALFSMLDSLPWDCTFEQSKPYSTVQNHLRQGGTAYAVDLSAATDYFPLKLQLSVLRALFGEQPDIDLFEELSRSEWEYKPGDFRVTWTNGQPMGLYPSFPAFALTHGILLDLLSGGVPNRFFVLGDDVIILHQPTYERYIETLKILGCPYNPDKTIISKGLTEFAGKIITTERVVSAFKWRDPNSNNFMELMRTFGHRFERLLRRRERRVYTRVKRVLPPYGCNQSTGLAKPLEDVVLETELLESTLPETSGRSVHTSFFHRLAEILRPGIPDSLFHLVERKWFKKQAESLDERTLMAFQNTPFLNFPGDRGVLVDILEGSGINPNLPAIGAKVRVDQQSLLEWYEHWLFSKPPEIPYGKNWVDPPVKWWVKTDSKQKTVLREEQNR